MDNLADAVSRDRLTHPGRVGKADRRGLYASAKAVRTAVLDALRQGTRAPDELEAVVAEAIAAGDPFAGHGTLFPAPPHQSVRHRQRKRGPDRPAPRWTADHPALF